MSVCECLCFTCTVFWEDQPGKAMQRGLEGKDPPTRSLGCKGRLKEEESDMLGDGGKPAPCLGVALGSDVFRQAPQKDEGLLLSLSQWLSVRRGRRQMDRVSVGWETLSRVLPPLGGDLQGHAVVPSSTSSGGVAGNQGPCSALPSPACCRCSCSSRWLRGTVAPRSPP